LHRYSDRCFDYSKCKRFYRVQSTKGGGAGVVIEPVANLNPQFPHTSDDMS
jgi:hypothetical protein